MLNSQKREHGISKIDLIGGVEILRAKLRYTDCLEDGKNVFRILSRNDVEILKTRRGLSIYPIITVLIDSSSELNDLLRELNNNCAYEVSLVRTMRSSKCDSCKQRDCCPPIKKTWHSIIDFFASYFWAKCN